MERKRRRLFVRDQLRGPTGPGFHGSTGFVASWRPLYRGRGAIRIGGSPFKTFAEAEHACNTMLNYLMNEGRCAALGPIMSVACTGDAC